MTVHLLLSTITGTAAITEYRRSTDDVSGTVDLLLTFIEAGTEQAADLGYGDENYFAALENKLDAVAKAWPALSGEERTRASTRLDWVRKRAQAIGWGYGDHVDEIVERLQTSRTQKRVSKNRTAV